MAILMRRTLIRTEAAILSRRGGWCRSWLWRSGCGTGRCAAGRRASRRPWRQSTGGDGWRAWCAMRCGRRRGRAGFPGAVFHLTAGTVEPLVEAASLDLASIERRHEEAQIGLVAGPFALADDSAPVREVTQGGQGEVVEAPGREAAPLCFCPCRRPACSSCRCKRHSGPASMQCGIQERRSEPSTLSWRCWFCSRSRLLPASP